VNRDFAVLFGQRSRLQPSALRIGSLWFTSSLTRFRGALGTMA
jgi:hypothetical protein